MQPTQNQDNRHLQVPARDAQTPTPPTSRDAAVSIMREQIDRIYEEPQPNEQIAASVSTQQAQGQTTSPYDQTHDTATDIQAAIDDDAVKAHWQQYHTQWQQYYQMYYERYYQAAQRQASESQAPTTPSTPAESNVATVSQNQAIHELRSELLGKVKTSSQKIRSNRHFRPLMVAVAVAAVFAVLQWNQILFANVMAFTVPSSTESSSSYIDPSTDVAVGNDPVLKIPKINVDAPVDYSLTTLQESVVQSKLKGGIVHYPIAGANALPGEIGNAVFLGHSANDVFDDGNYKFIFLHLDRLDKGDTFYINYGGKRYTYSITEKKVIDPTQVSELVLNNDKPMATLITCTPPGTALKRLLIIGEQIAPDPGTATTSTASPDTENDRSTIGGETKGFFERLFGG